MLLVSDLAKDHQCCCRDSMVSSALDVMKDTPMRTATGPSPRRRRARGRSLPLSMTTAAADRRRATAAFVWFLFGCPEEAVPAQGTGWHRRPRSASRGAEGVVRPLPAHQVLGH